MSPRRERFYGNLMLAVMILYVLGCLGSCVDDGCPTANGQALCSEYSVR